MSHSCRTPTRPPAPTLPQDTPQNLHRPPRALHHLPCRNMSSVLLLPTKVCCYLSQGAPMFRNERIIAKFHLITTYYNATQRLKETLVSPAVALSPLGTGGTIC